WTVRVEHTLRGRHERIVFIEISCQRNQGEHTHLGFQPSSQSTDRWFSFLTLRGSGRIGCCAGFIYGDFAPCSANVKRVFPKRYSNADASGALLVTVQLGAFCLLRNEKGD